MQADDFFSETTSMLPGGDPWGTVEELDEQLLEKLRAGHVPGRDDASAAKGLVELAREELEAYGTDKSNRLTNVQVELVIKTMYAVLARLGYSFQLPFRNFNRFQEYWKKNGGHGSWQARRDILSGLFDPLEEQIESQEEQELGKLAEPVSAQSATGWPLVDEEITELRRRFKSATSPQDYRAIGTHCVGVIEALSEVAFDSGKHLRQGEVEPPVQKSKNRLDRVIEDALPGEPNEELRGLAKRSVAVAHLIKHKSTPTGGEAGIASDAVILLASILRRLSNDPPD